MLIYTNQTSVANTNAVWTSPTGRLSVSIRVGRSVTSQGGPLITYIYLCGNGMQPLAYIFQTFTARDLNWNVRQAWKNLCTFRILSYADNWCLVPFSSNISCVRPQSVSVLARKKKRIVVYQFTCSVVRRGTQQENSATKHACTRRSSATLGGVNEA
jgi:hypothetical protein